MTSGLGACPTMQSRIDAPRDMGYMARPHVLNNHLAVLKPKEKKRKNNRGTL